MKIALACWVACGVIHAAASGSLAAPPPTSGSVKPAVDSFTLRADWFDRGNVRVSRLGENYADKYPCIWNAGQLPNRSEYDIEFPVTADYTLAALYAAHAARPVDIYLDGVKIHRGFTGVTGSWRTSSARWEPQCVLRVAAGKHTVKLVCPGACMPHICGLRFESPAPFPRTGSFAADGAPADGAERAAPVRASFAVIPGAAGRVRLPPAVRAARAATPRAHRVLEYAILGDGKHRVEAQIIRTANAAPAHGQRRIVAAPRRPGTAVHAVGCPVVGQAQRPANRDRLASPRAGASA